ncbi:response regulator [Leptospira kanakyensis]|uniref:response regulator n=2 Tax=Leptospira kanakyensis TaxID=2484968 RepID=UPI00223CB91C|nr:response regulator [Leptospira kanakyensis]MCW7482686.1 response regulator [Leptospira kanakyensis]
MTMESNLVTGKSILLVEDEAIIAMMQIRILKSAGFIVHHVRTGETAISFLSQPENKIDIILMDIDLGSGIDGTEAARIILSKHSIPLVFLSSHTETEIVNRTESITSYGYILKTTGEIVLIASIKMALRLFESIRKQSEAQELFEKAFLISPIAMSLHDIGNQFRFVNVNPAFERLVGFQKNEVVGKTSSELNMYAQGEDGSEIREKFLTEGKLTGYKQRFKLRNGEVKEGNLSIELVEINGKPHALTFQNLIF